MANKGLVMAFDAPYSPSDPNYTDWVTYGQPNVSGATLSAPWNTYETSPGVYNFSTLDTHLSSFTGKVAVAFYPQSLQAATQYIPTAYYNQIPSNHIVSCTEGANNVGPMVVPWDDIYLSAWENFIEAAIAHYNSNRILSYMRFGFLRGGQTSIQCNEQLAYVAGGFTALQELYIEAYEDMIDTIVAANSSTPVQIETACGPNGSGSNSGDCTDYADLMAAYNAPNCIGIGTGGFQPADLITNPASGDWVNNFNRFRFTGMARELQPLVSGYDLSLLMPFAEKNYANVVELQLAYVATAFVPPGNASWATAITNFMNGT